MRQLSYSFDERCLDLARYFFPDVADGELRALAQELQQCVEDFHPGDTPLRERPEPALSEHLIRALQATAAKSCTCNHRLSTACVNRWSGQRHCLCTCHRGQ